MRSSTVFWLALPLIFSNLTVPLLGLVDTAVVGHLHQADYLAAVGVGAIVFDFLYFGLGFLRMATTGLCAQAYGRQDALAGMQVLLRGLLLAFMLAFLLLLLQKPVGWLAAQGMGATPAVNGLFAHYFSVRIWGAPAALANMVVAGWLIGVHKPRYLLLTMIVVNVVAMGLDILFVWGFGLWASGVALANVIAQYLGLGLGLYWIFRLLRRQGLVWQLKGVLSRQAFVELLHLNKNIFFRTMCLMAVFLGFTHLGARLGTVVLAANIVLMNFQNLMANALDGFANAAEALVGRAVGVGDHQALRQCLRQTAVWSFAVAAGITVIYCALLPWAIGWLTDLPDVIAMAKQFAPFAILAPLVSVWSYWLDGVFIGATRTRAMRNTMALACFGFFLTYICLAPYGNYALWSAFFAFMLVRGASLQWVLWRRPLP